MNALILPGGGSNGDWQAGVLYKIRPEPDIIFGTSVGGLNGIVVATGQAWRLKEIWMQVRQSKVVKKRGNRRVLFNQAGHFLFGRDAYLGYYDNSPLRDMLVKYCLGKKVYVDYYCSFVLLQENMPDLYMKHHIRKGTVVSQTDIDYVLATTAIPVIFEPVPKGDALLVDGGVHHQSPVTESIMKHGVTSMLAIPCSPLDPKRTKQPKNALEMTMWTLSTMLNNSFYEGWERMELMNKILMQSGPLEIDGHTVRYIKNAIIAPDEPLGNSLDFSHEKIKQNFEKGYEQRHQSPY